MAENTPAGVGADGDAEADGDVEADAAATIARLQRRLDRERRARNEAFGIAERGLRSLYDANQELDRRIEERTEQLRDALTAAENASQAKSVFLGQMCHQLNTPLNGLLGMLELLSADTRDTQSQEWYNSALRSARRLERLTTRLATYVALEDRDLRSNAPRQALSDVLASVHDRWHGPCLRAGQLLTVTADAPGAELLAGVELDIMFDELLSNVVAHAGPGAATLDAKSELHGLVTFRLTDSGPGPSESDFAGVHGLAAEPQQTTKADAAVSLGLALIDRIVAGLGGTWSVGGPGTGQVTIVLPMA